MLSIGLMSGTSMDGIDVALLETDGTADLIQDLGHTSIVYHDCFKTLLKAAEFVVRIHLGDLEKAAANFYPGLQSYLLQELNLPKELLSKRLAELAHYLHNSHSADEPIKLSDVIRHSTDLHVNAVQTLLLEIGFSATQINVVGYHGQALFHRPSLGKSVIVGDGQYLADQIGIPVVNDFRSRDIAAGGQGAPFAPIYHHALALRDQRFPVAVVNCGGIANVTYIPNSEEASLIGFDTGPGNGLIDKLVRQRTHGVECMDRDGNYGKKGLVRLEVLSELYKKALFKDGKNYFLIPPPKSLDIGDMRLIPELDDLSLEDACATLEAFTADSILQSFELLDIPLPKQWILAGGGWHNPMIRDELEMRLNERLGYPADVMTADQVGWNSQAMEAQLFAYLAVRSIQNKPLSFPNTTNVPEPMCGGEFHFPTIEKSQMTSSPLS